MGPVVREELGQAFPAEGMDFILSDMTTFD